MNETVNVTFIPLRISGRVPKGITILNAAREMRLGIEGPCNGAGTCGKDVVQIRRDGRLETVLACKSFLEEDTEVIVPHHDKDIKAVENFFWEYQRNYPINPSIKKTLFANKEGRVSTAVFIDGRLIAEEDGDTTSKCFGTAVDIGTTTIAASIINLNDGATEGYASILNPLIYYGHDVMSRIKYSISQKNGLNRMHEELISSVNLLIDIISSDNNISKENIYQILAAGNTTMQHIFLNKDISGIGRHPYKAEILDMHTASAGELSIGVRKSSQITTFPCVSAYVGGDIVSGLIAVNNAGGKLPALFIDIGTNGEMALITESGITATSCAAGPCFEGMTISCGMRAGNGAIERVSLWDAVSLEVIGGGAPRGICGSGLLDMVSEMIRLGLVNSKGRLQSFDSPDIPKIYRKHLFQKEGKRFFRLHEGITVSQEDIRQVQLARAAIRTGVELLLLECGVRYGDLKKIIIAGGFGYHISRESLVTVGLIPDFPNAEITFVGNSSLEGARIGMLNKETLDSSKAIVKSASVMELANISGFEKRFIKEMHFL